MGFQTIVGILNDRWHSICENPDQLIQAVEAGMQMGDRELGHVGGITVIPSHHADDYQLCLSGGNMVVALDLHGLKHVSKNIRDEFLAEARRIVDYYTEYFEAKDGKDDD